MDIEDVADVMRRSRLGGFGHLERKDEGDWVSACRNMVVPGNAEKGRPRKMWRDILEDDLKKGRLGRGIAKDGASWRAQIMRNTPICASTEKGTYNEKRERERLIKCELFQWSSVILD